MGCSGSIALVIAWLLSPGGSQCADPLFMQYQARIGDRATVQQQVDGWEDFLRTYPDNPCADRAREILHQLESSRRHHAEAEEKEEWKQKARGGLIEPDRGVFPPFAVLPDPQPRNRVRIQNELIWPTDRASFRTEIDDPVLTQILRVDVAPISFLGLSLDVPLAAGARWYEDYSYAFGNITLGVRGIWGSTLREGQWPFVLSGGILWGTGSSNWTPGSAKRILNTAAFSTPYFFYFFRDHLNDYAFHAEGQIGLGKHVLGAALAYHILTHQSQTSFKTPPDPATHLFRFDLAWQLEVLGWLFPSFELNAGVGSPGSSETTHLFLAPGVRFRFRHFSAALGIRVPFLDASDFSRVVLSMELEGRL